MGQNVTAFREELDDMSMYTAHNSHISDCHLVQLTRDCLCQAIFYVVSTGHFGMKLYNDQRNAQVFNVIIYLILPYMFRDFY
jgi:hypothetical protein